MRWLGRLFTNLLILMVSPALVLGIAEWSTITFKSRKILTYFDQQTHQELGSPIPEKQPGEYRIFIFGSSAAYGFPVADRYSITAWINKSVKYLLPNRKVRMVNCAWPGKSSFQAVEGARTVLKYRPDLFIIYCGNNEATTSNRVFDNPLYKLNLKLKYRSAFYRYLNLRLDRLRKHIVYGRSGYAEKHYREEVIANIVLKNPKIDDEEYGRILERYKKNMSEIIRVAKSHGVDVLFVSLPANIRDIPPTLSDHRPGLTTEELSAWTEKYDAGKKALEGNLYNKALASFLEAGKIDDAHAELQFLLGKTYEALGNFLQAKRSYVAACDLDRVPMRARTALNQTIRDLARNNGLIFVDIVAALERVSQNGIISSGLIYDNVHPSVEAEQVIADEILRELQRLGRPAPSDEWQWQELEHARENQDSEEWKIDGSLNAYRFILRGLHLWEQQRYEQAVPDLEKGLELMPKFIESYAFLADSLFHLGRKAQASLAFQELASKDKKLLDLLLHKYPDIYQSYSEALGTVPAAA